MNKTRPYEIGEEAPEDLAEPPEQPPSCPPRLRFRRVEGAGIVLVAAIPLIAMAGGFGPHAQRTQLAAGPVILDVSYPDMTRTGLTETIEGRVINRSASPAAARVEFAPDYMDAFIAVAATPAAEAAFEIAFDDLGPGEEREFRIVLEAERFGSAGGRLTLQGNGQRHSIPMSTFIFP